MNKVAVTVDELRDLQCFENMKSVRNGWNKSEQECENTFCKQRNVARNPTCLLESETNNWTYEINGKHKGTFEPETDF